MHELLQKFLIGAHAAWRWRWFGLAAFWFTCIAAWAIVAFIPDRYSSSAQVEIDTESMLRPLMQGIAAEVDTEALTRVEIVRRSLFSRSNIEKVMRMADLDILAETPGELEQLVASIQVRLSIIRNRKDRNLFTISFIDTNPEVARDVVKAFLTIFAEANLIENREDIERTKRFLAGQIQLLEQQLVTAEKRLSQFRVLNREFLPGEGGLQDQLEGLVNELDSINVRRSEDIRSRDQVKLQIARTRDIEGPQGFASPQAERIAELEKELKLLLTRFKESHPDVVALRRLLNTEKADFEASKALESDEESSLPIKSSSQLNQLNLQLSEYDARIGIMNRRIETLEGRAADIREKLLRLPEVQSEYARLERDYEIIKQNHVALLERREEVRFASEIDTKSEAVEFRVVSPPNLPLKPNAPNRRLLRAGGMTLGLGAGVALPVLLSLAFPTFGSTLELERITHRPVIGRITMVTRSAGRLRRSAGQSAFIIFLVTLFVIGALIIAGVPDEISRLISDISAQLNLKQFLP